MPQATQQKPVRKLRSWEAAALSVGFMAPLLAMSLNGIGVAGLVGTSVSFVFLVAFAGTAFIAYGFVRLTRRFNHAGSVYALAGRTIGPRAGFFGGFALLGTYVTFAACTLAACAVFLEAWMTAWNPDAASLPWILASLAAAVLALTANFRESRFTARLLTAIGGFGVLLMLILGGVILVKAATGAAPVETAVDLSLLLPGEVPLSTLLTASVFAFLSWAGFESCASLGEETANPRKAIPLALGGSVVGCGLIYVFMMFSQQIGFGSSEEGAAAFAASSSSLTELAGMYISREYALLLAFAAFMVAFASTLSSTAAASRLVFALARDGFGPRSLSVIHPGSGIPRRAVAAVTATAAVLAVLLWAGGVGAFDAYYWYATIAVLCLLVAYATTTAGVAVHILSGKGSIPRWELVLPVIGIAYLVFVFVVQSVDQPAPYSYFPAVAAAWCLVGAGIVIAAPAMARRIGERLIEEDASHA